MSLKESLNWLIENGYAVIVQNQIVFTKKCAEELKVMGVTAKTNEDVPTITIAVPVKPEGERPTGDKKEIWNKFIEDAQIPHRVKAPDGGIYTVRQYSPGCALKLFRIIANPEIDYMRLVESTRHYYKTVTYKALLGNYIEKEIWRSEYEAWENKNTKEQPLTNGENRWEN
jgi:hypothetical protein